MNKRKGFFKIAQVGGVPVLAHWSFPLAGMFVAFLVGGSPVQWIAYILAVTCLILIHEFGHFIAARFLGLKIFAVEVLGFGGALPHVGAAPCIARRASLLRRTYRPVCPPVGHRDIFEYSRGSRRRVRKNGHRNIHLCQYLDVLLQPHSLKTRSGSGNRRLCSLEVAAASP